MGILYRAFRIEDKVSVYMKTTRYGLSPRAGGWDIPGDSGTDNWIGCFGNKLNTASCALTVSAESALSATLPEGDSRLGDGSGKLKPHTLLKVTFLAPMDKMVIYRTFDDRAPESDDRLDNFLPIHDDPTIPDRGLVSVV